MSTNKIIREYIIILLCLTVVIYFVGKGMFILALSPVFIMLFFKTLPNPAFPFLLIFIVKALDLRLPFYPHNMPNELPFVAWYVSSTLASYITKKKSTPQQHLTTVQIISLFILVFDLAILALARGIDNISAFWYMVIASGFLTFTLSRDLHFNKKQLQTLIIFIITGTIIKAATQAFLIFTGNQYLWIGGFIDVSTESSIGTTSFGRRVYIKRFAML
ncbi:MAG: hypothetical protein DRI57_31515, partial [Deltaproteobacteria bacterium]